MIRRFFNDSAIYAIPNILSRGIGFFLLPVYTHYLTPSEYGVLEFLVVAFVILNLTLPLEISQAVARLFVDVDQKKKALYASTSFWFTAIGFSLFAVIVWLFPEDMAKFVLGNETLVYEVCVGALAMIINALFLLMQNQLRWTLQPKAYAVTSLLFSLVTAMLAVMLIAGFGMGVMGFIWGQLVGSIFALSGALYFARNTVPIGFALDLTSLKEMLSFSSPLVISGIAVYFTLYADRWMVRELLSIDDVGIYSVAYRVATIASLPIAAFQMSLAPLVYQHYKDPQTPRLIGEIFSWFLLFVLPLILLIGAFSPEIVSMVTAPEYLEAAQLVPWLTLAVVLMSVYVFSPGLGIAKKTRTIALINIVAAAVNILLNLIWIPEFGRIGAAIATLCSAFVMAGMYFWLGNREYIVAYRKWRSGLVIFLTVLLMLLVSVFTMGLPTRIMFWFVFVVVISGVLITTDDWDKLRVFFLKK